MKLFTCTVSAFSDDALVGMPGFSHRGQPEKSRVSWYPFEEWRVRVHLFARHRSHACAQLTRAGAPNVRDLDSGRVAEVPASIAKQLEHDALAAEFRR